MSLIRTRIEQLRERMRYYGIDLYLVPTADFHQSEYVGEYFKSREFLSGFTGSAGMLLVTKEEAGLWTDGRYFIQAQEELKDSGIILFHMGEPGIPTVQEYAAQYMKTHECIGFDGRTMSVREVERLLGGFLKETRKVIYDKDLSGEIWKNRLELSGKPAYILSEEQAGEAAFHKLERLRKKMREYGATVHVLTALDDIAWLFNIRGNDVEYNPVVLSYAVITLKAAFLFVHSGVFSKEQEQCLNKIGIQIKAYDEIYENMHSVSSEECILLSKEKVNYSLYRQIPKECRLVYAANPTSRFKACKNASEIAQTKEAHILDGIAVTKFIYWLKTGIGKTEITEMSAAGKLEELRKKQKGFVMPSFTTISAYGPHAAMMHYSVTAQTDVPLKPEGMLLVDSGGQYKGGTTDITRTIVLGPLLPEVKRQYTAVVCGMLRLLHAKFLYGCSGINLDILARGAVWEIGMDYQCGTGHGVGHFLNVHEGPNGIRWKKSKEAEDWSFEEGMITTDEPGVYVEGSYGIRVENELLCVKGNQSAWGQFMEFENLTFAPIDIDGIETAYMTDRDVEYLNEYHKRVYQCLADKLSGEEKEWLAKVTAPLKKERGVEA